MTFSSAVMLTDLNDFISPSQSCIKPVEMPKKSNNETKVKVDNGEYYEVQIDGTEKKLEQATITLNDCLACSGCITSAESVLISMQSHEELYKAMQQSPRKIIVISISSQSRASFAAKYGLSQQQVWQRLQYFFRASVEADYIFDIDFAREIVLLESANEFYRRFTAPIKQPMLASFCPGWVCYAEKTHGDILHLLDTTKSPQQVMGSLVKDYLAVQLGVTPDQIYHVTIMPCFDKKLEASREDFHNDVYNVRDVDLVLSTLELESMINEKFQSIVNIQEADFQTLYDSAYFRFMKGDGLNLYPTEGSSSGGYLSFILRSTVYKLFNIAITPEDIFHGTNGVSLHPGKNSDFLGIHFTPPGNSEPALKFAYAFGFRNIQNLVRKWKPGKRSKKGVEYDFIEVSACPSSCINGGGQLKVASEKTGELSIVASKEWINASNESYHASNYPVLATENNQNTIQIINTWLGGLDSQKSHETLHTAFHAVKNNFTNNLAVNW